MVWLVYLRGDERTFWRTMTPARCWQLYKQYAKMHFAPQRKLPEKPSSGGSLSQYLMGGG